MKAPQEPPRLVTLPVSDWLQVDAVLDNEVSLETGDDQAAELILRIRETGWAQLPDWPTEPCLPKITSVQVRPAGRGFWCGA
ncbi:hypothetical protein [Actinomadura nitritigenes]|uniref:Transposase n=1 Tax=Actinomadura nitritigenes TaxID=134602 RepID=A0ABS3RBU1_9ACTN|nr:hypothetical protein [Actinomadura nitritigenes]MBO2443570.1 hypothetical protein [Actinomadura nitritigenes]